MSTTQILCAVHGGPESRHTVNRGIELARETNARLTFFHAMDAEFLQHATIGPLSVVYRELEEMGRFVLMILEDRARKGGVTAVDHVLREGNTRQQLIKMAVETGAGVMILGRPNRQPGKNVFKRDEFDTFVA